jgi:hypothetical protein
VASTTLGFLESRLLPRDNFFPFLSHAAGTPAAFLFKSNLVVERKQSKPPITSKHENNYRFVTGGFDTGEKITRPTQPPE